VTNNEGKAVLHKISKWLCQRRREYTGPFLKVARLFAREDANLDISDNSGKTPLHWAVDNAYDHLVKFLIDSGAKVNLADNEGQTPLDIALGQHAFDTMMLLLENGAKCQSHVPQNITEAAMLGNSRAVRKFIAAGQDVNEKDLYGRTALLYAVELGYTEVVEILITSGADLGIKDPRLNWIWDDKPSVGLEPTENKGPGPVRPGSFQFTPLHLAARNGHVDIAELLITGGADVNAKAAFSGTPLDVAGTEEMKNLLRRNGAVSGMELKPADN
jgi:ankyrin repeat protein